MGVVFSPYADTISMAFLPSCVIGLAQETGPLSKTRLARRSRTDSRLLSTRWYSTIVLRFFSLIFILSPTWKSESKTGEAESKGSFWLGIGLRRKFSVRFLFGIRFYFANLPVRGEEQEFSLSSEETAGGSKFESLSSANSTFFGGEGLLTWELVFIPYGILVTTVRISGFVVSSLNYFTWVASCSNCYGIEFSVSWSLLTTAVAVLNDLPAIISILKLSS